MFFGYRSYLDFGWRIFKLFGTDLRMRTVYETFLWLKAISPRSPPDLRPPHPPARPIGPPLSRLS